MTPAERRVALLAFHYWPDNTSGSARAGRFAKYLPYYSYDCRVIAGGSGETGNNVLHVPGTEAGIGERLAIHAAEIVQRILPNNERLGWVPAATQAACALASRTPVSAIISTSPPVATQIAGLWLKQRLGLPWIADFRDPLLGNPTRVQGWLPGFDVFLERRILESADALLANTDGVLESWARRYPFWRHKMHLLWNGYDPEVIQPAEPPKAGLPRILAHVGVLYGRRHPGQLVESLDRLIRKGLLDPGEFRLRLVGSSDGVLERYVGTVVARLRELGCLEMNGPVSAAEAAAHMRRAHYLLLLDFGESQVPAKVFDYVLAGRPFLVWTKPGSPVSRVVVHSGVRHRFVFHGSSEEQIDRAVLELLRLEPALEVPSTEFLREFDGRDQVRRLAGILDGLLHAGGGVHAV